MPRKARIDAPGALHHIIVRGIEKKAIFRDVVDRKDFLKRLGAILIDTETNCYGWVLMRNHVHLLLRTGLAPIATVMRRLLTGYAVSFNRRYRRQVICFKTSKHRRIVQARAVLCYLAVRKLRFSCADVARRLNINPNTVSMALRRGQKIEDIKTIQKQLLEI